MLRPGASCDTGGRGSALAYIRLGPAIVTIRDETLPALDAGGPLFESGWHRAESDIAYTASDNTGIKNVRLLVDGQERNRHRHRRATTRFLAHAQMRGVAGSGLAARRSPTARGRSQVVAEDAAGNV